MSVFIERFLLAILAALTVLLAVTNPIGFSDTARIIGVIIIFILAGIAAYLSGKYGGYRKYYRHPTPRSTENRKIECL
jgi:hypothetical protein